MWALYLDLCGTQHGKPHVMCVLDEDEALKSEADMTNAYLIEGY